MKLVTLNISIKLNNNKKVLNFLKKENADIVLLQEVMHGIEPTCTPQYTSENFLKEKLMFQHSHFAPLFEARCLIRNGENIRDFGGLAQQGSLILSKHPIIVSKNQFYYNNYKTDYDVTFFKEKDWCRSIQNCILEINEKKLQVINVHGIWNKDKMGDERTIAQSRFILEKLERNMPCIVAGDFNLLPETQSIEIFAGGGLQNLIKQYNVPSTRPHFSDGLDKGGTVADYAFVKNVKVKNFKVPEVKVSDHLPLVLEFEPG